LLRPAAVRERRRRHRLVHLGWARRADRAPRGADPLRRAGLPEGHDRGARRGRAGGRARHLRARGRCRGARVVLPARPDRHVRARPARLAAGDRAGRGAGDRRRGGTARPGNGLRHPRIGDRRRAGRGGGRACGTNRRLPAPDRHPLRPL
ncbi:MAG: hypothetical protein AVDCRST_MAG88-1495, partial [uncultured Thermomicrobiales bacterium]